MNDAVEDSELLRRYAEEASEAAFAELVRRRIGLVFSVALRQTHGDRHRAEDATQAVFTDLARKARGLAARPVLGGWLYRSAQFAATDLVRAERRRLAREQEAHRMENDARSDEPATDWDRLRPVLDEALNEIDERDRDAVVLRFFDNRPFAEIGARLRLTDNAARMRVERALDKLQAALARRGITSTAAAVGLALGSQVATAAPAGLAVSVTNAALAGTAATAGGAAAFLMGMTKLQVAAVAVLVAAGSGAYVWQAKANTELRRDIAAAQVAPATLAALQDENRRLAAASAEIEMLRGDDAELKQLEQQVGEVRQAQSIRNGQARPAQTTPLSPAEVLVQTQAREMERLNREGAALVEEYKALRNELANPALPQGAKAAKQAAVDTKLEAIKAKQKAIQELSTQIAATLIEPTGKTPSAGEFTLRKNSSSPP